MRLTAGVVQFPDLAEDLDVAVRDGQLAAVFQPQIDLGSGRIVAVEGLCRWVHPRHGPIAPDEFIPLAESTGAIHGIGRFMIDECIAAADRWSSVAARIGVSVNVSPLQLTARFADELRDRWRRCELPDDALTLEITESLPVTDLEASVPRLAALREVGIGISLDDYGTGHASIAQIDRLPVTEVKLDRSLIQSYASSPADEIANVVAFAHDRELRVVAEGIESVDQLDFARDVGCDRAQGYLLGNPMPATWIEELLSA
ncbi:EAL domain-containing protein [Microbacterium sp. 18062]|uniref:EAL domain-containing protein n=1 Tax=Microbacterium sp. 18062 TaxID=2681410 RepID=UPI00135CAB07|nr:EAL domain-containing protein [Microbacterium sp. 18062]